ncbi:unnamed protein product [Pseudo-nitzschia multistriata]|uniref:AB hydrolase-1 domain-containing protein n=1 Tax=Pseudo-nitzschia multistriata TaxID=183589 RepID=A0A448ZF71_9STRA|nr:unnamed protein product [Pseudo-nitzschia multistriata]VEU40841.1 unnamed protein product [Pseudo-nitzschia multistriata]
MSEKEKTKSDHSFLPESSSMWAIRPYPDPIDTSLIEADGGKWIRLDDGRVVEYFVSGSSSPDARVLVDCPGGNCTGRLFSAVPAHVGAAEELNYKVVSVSVPGFGYSSIQPGRRIKDWPITDLLPVLKKEKVGEFLVTGTSFGTCHALATAWQFAEEKETGGKHESGVSCIGMGLRVPYLGSESCKQLELENHLSIGYTSTSANTSLIGTVIARLFTSFASRPGDAFEKPGRLMSAFVNLLNPGALAKLERLMTDHHHLMKTCKVDMERCVAHSDQGILYNYATDTLLDHGFLVTEIWKDLPVVVWYAEDDEDCPPSHGKWIANKHADNTDKDEPNHFTNVSSRVFAEFGHIGTAFLNHDEFLRELHGHVTAQD